MTEFEIKPNYNLEDFRDIIALLRSPKGCPWDREQTHQSIRRNLLEEAYEAAEAIDLEDTNHLCEELGDVLMQVIFHANIEEQAGRFDLDQVADMAVKKLIYRHPHVFGNTKVTDSDQVLHNWEMLKRAEKNQETVSDSMASVAKSLPALWQAEKILKKAAKAYGEQKVGEMIKDPKAALDGLSEALKQDSDQIENAFGDLIFSAVNAIRAYGIDPEMAVSQACQRFIAETNK